MRDDLMVQQQVTNKWQHVVGVICLNQTGRKQVKAVLPLLFDKYPTPELFLHADFTEVQEIISPLGMKNVRTKRLFRMTQDFMHWDGDDASDLYGIGKYGSDSYEIFYKNNIPSNIGDHELKRYVREEYSI